MGRNMRRASTRGTRGCMSTSEACTAIACKSAAVCYWGMHSWGWSASQFRFSGESTWDGTAACLLAGVWKAWDVSMCRIALLYVGRYLRNWAGVGRYGGVSSEQVDQHGAEEPQDLAVADDAWTTRRDICVPQLGCSRCVDSQKSSQTTLCRQSASQQRRPASVAVMLPAAMANFWRPWFVQLDRWHAAVFGL